jgi:hypothetical protein
LRGNGDGMGGEQGFPPARGQTQTDVRDVFQSFDRGIGGDAPPLGFDKRLAGRFRPVIPGGFQIGAEGLQGFGLVLFELEHWRTVLLEHGEE